MDEAEKYKQRLEAIAEKRRLQEEEERARREMEDERLRLQQLKRKSLRDQWLMEGAPLSPTSLDTLSSRSPPWGFQAQEMEKLSESQQLAEEKDKWKVQMEDGQTKTETLAEAEKEMDQSDIVQNGENNTGVSESSEDEVKTTQSSLQNKTAISLTNGTKDFEAITNHSDSKPSAQSATNGPVCISESVVSLKSEPGLSLGVSEAESGQAPNASVNDEDDEGTVVMRAERVIITDEGDEQDAVRSEVSPLPNPEESQREEEPVEGETTKTEESEATRAAREAQQVSEDDMNTDENAETKDDGQDKAAASTTTVAPVHSENQPDSEQDAAVSPEGPAVAASVFQEVPLTDPPEKQQTDVGVGEQEPLLLQTRAQVTQEAANIPASTAQSPSGAVHGEPAKAASHKTCQCCSIM